MRSKKPSRDVECFFCGEKGHYASYCPEKKKEVKRAVKLEDEDQAW